MSAAQGLLVLGLVSAVATFCVVYRARRIGFLLPLYFFTAWLQGELALIHIIWQGLLALGLIACGALSEPSGCWGLVFLLLSFSGLGYTLRLSGEAGETFRKSLVRALGPDYRQRIPSQRRALLQDGVEWRQWMKPFAMKRPGVERIRDISYGPAGERNLLDIYRPHQRSPEPAPVLLQVHGGGWMIGNKDQQALPLMNHLAQRGWICVSINYRLSPHHPFPAHIQDVKRALAWIKAHIAEYGGDPEFVAITGGSAGGHLSSLAALTPNYAPFQPGFEAADTTVQAAVPFYGVYDWFDESGSGGSAHMTDLLAKYVMQSTADEEPELWRKGRSIAHINAGAPPTLVVQGSHDSLVWAEDARHFAAVLGRVSQAPVAYAEVRGAQHAFDIFHSIRCDHAVNGVSEFLEWCHAEWQEGRSRA